MLGAVEAADIGFLTKIVSSPPRSKICAGMTQKRGKPAFGPRLAPLAIALALLPLLLWRASLESSLWIDETYSLMLTTYPVGRLVEHTAADSHPPLYYLVLKAWLKIGRALGLEGVLWARLLNVAAWASAAGVVAWGSRRLFGLERAWLVTAAVVASAVSGLVARDLRSYAFAVPALTLAFFALLGLSRLALGDRRRLWLWAGFVLAASVAVWSHLLAALALAVLLPLWLGLELPGCRRRRHLVCEASGASLAVLASYLPWLPRVSEQISSVEAGSTAWMTAPNLGNWLLTFSFWLPFGRIGYLNEPTNRLLLPLGMVAVLLPLAALAGSVLRPRKGERDPLLERFTLLGLGTTVLFVTLLWLLDRFGLAPVFDAPRYPNLVANLWTAGLVGVCLLAGARFGWRLSASAALLAPWLLCGLLGQVYLGAKESRWGLANLKPQIMDMFPPSGEPLYVMPSELIPYYRRSLAEYALRGVEELPCTGASSAATVVDVNFWKKLDRPRDHLARALIESQALSGTVASQGFPEPQRDYVVHRLIGLKSEALAALCASGFAPRSREALARALSSALPEDQPPTADWSYLEVNGERELYRWASGDPTRLRFDRAVAPGRYKLVVEGARTAWPSAEVMMTLAFVGESDRLSVRQPEGRFRLELPVVIEHPLPRLMLEISHPTWSPALAQGSGDTRTLSFLFLGAWLEAEASAPPAEVEVSR